MSDYIVQLKDDTGNKQYPVTLAQCIVDDDGTVIGEKLDMLETAITNLKTVGGQSIVGSNGGENIPFKKINIDGTSYDVVGSGTIDITTSQDIDIKTLNDADGSHSLLGSGEVNFKKINNQSIFGEGQIDLSNLIADSAGIEYRPLLFDVDDVPEGYDSYTTYNAETFALVLEGKVVPIYVLGDVVTPSNIIIAAEANAMTLQYELFEGSLKASVFITLDLDGNTSINDFYNTTIIDTNAAIFYLDNIYNGSLQVKSNAVLSYISCIMNVRNIRSSVGDELNIIEPIAYVTASSDPTVSCIVNSAAVVGTGEGLIIEYDFGESRFRRTYTISGSNATYTEEEISLGGGAGEGAYIGPEQPDDNLPVNLWVDTSDDENVTETISVVDHLTSTDSTAVLSANMGRELKTMIDNSIGDINTVLDNINGEIK